MDQSIGVYVLCFEEINKNIKLKIKKVKLKIYCN